jgi:hypothetical protein
MPRVILIVGLLAAIPGLARADEGRRVRQALLKPTNTLPIPKTALGDVLNSFSDRFNLVIVIDTAAFKARDRDDVASRTVELPKLQGVSLSTALRLLVGQVGGSVVQIGGQLWVVPPEDRVARMLSQKVDVHYKNQPLGEVLADFTERTGVPIEPLPNLAPLLDRKVSCDWKQVRADRAVERLASLARLDAVLMEDCLVVGTPEMIRDLRLLLEADMPR